VKKAVARGAGEAMESIDARLEDMGRKMDRLRALYESHFLGIERTPPNIPRRELNRLMVEMQQSPINNATLRFRFQSLLQKWVLYTTYWNRTLQEIEAGTYRRDLARARRHMAERGGSITEQEALALGIPASRVRAFVGRQSKTVRSGPTPETSAAADPAAAPPASVALTPPPSEPPAAAPPSPAAATSPPLASAGKPSPVPGAAKPAPTPAGAAKPAPTPPASVAPRPAAPAPAGAKPAEPARAMPPPPPAAARLSEKQLADFYRRYSDAHKQALGTPPKASPEQLRGKLEKLLEGQSFGKVELDVSFEAGKLRVRARPVK
jgi:hypothetical protein